MSPIVRLTLFKIPDPAAVQQAVQKYSTLAQDALKVTIPSPSPCMSRAPSLPGALLPASTPSLACPHPLEQHANTHVAPPVFPPTNLPLQTNTDSSLPLPPQDGKPYIQLSAGHIAHADPRSRGYTFIARTVFLSNEDMSYYDESCAAHGAIKALLKGKVDDGPPVVMVMDG